MGSRLRPQPHPVKPITGSESASQVEQTCLHCRASLVSGPLHAGGVLDPQPLFVRSRGLRGWAGGWREGPLVQGVCGSRLWDRPSRRLGLEAMGRWTCVGKDMFPETLTRASGGSWAKALGIKGFKNTFLVSHPSCPGRYIQRTLMLFQVQPDPLFLRIRKSVLLLKCGDTRQ